MNEIHPGGNARSYICQCLCSARWTSALLIVAVPSIVLTSPLRI